MASIETNGIRIEYERAGPVDGVPLLLIHGVGAQLVRWSQSLIDGFVGAGFHVLRFDNRDVGLSTHMNDGGVPDLASILAAKKRGDAFDLPYTLSDMAADTAGLLDALGIESAHVMGVSLGGMIAQQLAIDHPSKVRSMTIVMSQSGNPENAASDPQALAALTTPAPDPSLDMEGFLRHSLHLNRAIGSPAYPVAEDKVRAFAARAAARAYNPAGAARQMAAGRGAPDRRPALATLDIPTLVIHGADDPLIGLAGGEDIARTVPGAWLLTLHGMGHDLPEALEDIIISTVAANTRRADPA
jgi:pimeloyl-ACP methyl ester carboxylesterase